MNEFRRSTALRIAHRGIGESTVPTSLKFFILGGLVFVFGLTGAFLTEFVPWLMEHGIENYLNLSLTEKFMSLTVVGIVLFVLGCVAGIIEEG